MGERAWLPRRVAVRGCYDTSWVGPGTTSDRVVSVNSRPRTSIRDGGNLRYHVQKGAMPNGTAPFCIQAAKRHARGLMFWFRVNRFVGSHRDLMASRRAMVFSP